MPLELSSVHALYDEKVPPVDDVAAGRIHPFVGKAYTDAEPALRVMAIGVNCYCDDGKPSQPGWFPWGFAEQKWSFQKGVLRDARVFARALAGSTLFGVLPFLGIESVYLTNAVKRWLPQSVGKKAHKVPERHLEEGLGVFRAELDLLAAAQVLPHIVLVQGDRPWPHVWPAFGKPRPSWATDYQTSPDPLFHHLNVVTVREGAGERPLLLAKVRHCTGSWGSKGMTPKKLLGQGYFRHVAGLAALPAPA